MNPIYREVYFHCQSALFPPTFAIITAENPNGDAETLVSRNQEYTQRLKHLLEGKEVEIFPINAGARDRSHLERSFGIDLPLEVAIAVGKEFEQDAIFWVDDGELFLISCKSNERERVGVWKDRVIED